MSPTLFATMSPITPTTTTLNALALNTPITRRRTIAGVDQHLQPRHQQRRVVRPGLTR